MLACRHGHRDVAASLLRAGAHPDAPHPALKRPPMALAIERSDAVLAEILAAAVRPNPL